MQFSIHTIIVADYPAPGQYLLYNTRTQALVTIDHALKDFIDHFHQPSYAFLRSHYADRIIALHKMGILAQNFDEDIERLKSHMSQLKHRVNPAGLSLTILTTYACNLKCTYCFEESSRTTERMTPQTAEQTMNWIKAKIDEFGYKLLYLNFYGGEPLLNKPALEEIASRMGEWCRARGVAFKFMMQTNGYLMTPALIDKYLQLGLQQVRISLDGIGEDHDKYRPLRGGGGTFERIMNNIADCCDKVKIGISTSFDKGEVGHIERMLNYFQDRGILHKLGRFIFSPLHPTLGPNGKTEMIQNAHCECNFEDASLVEANRKIRAMLAAKGLEQKSGMSTSICPVTRHESGCTIDQQGRIFRCNSMLGHPELSTGHVRDAVYNERHHEFVNLDVYNQCPQDCTYMPMCSGGCRLTSFLKNQNFRTPSCHKPYLNKMAPEIIKKEYQDKIAAKKFSAVS